MSIDAAKPESQEEKIPNWMRRGLPGPGHAALEPLVGTRRVHMSFYATSVEALTNRQLSQMVLFARGNGSQAGATSKI